MLDEFTKIRIRTHLGVPVQGINVSGAALGYRFFEGSQVGLLEFRMNNLQPYEEATVTGFPIASISVAGRMVTGDAATITVNGTPITYTVLLADQAPVLTSTQTNVAASMAVAITNTVSGVTAAANPPITNVAQGIFPSYATLIVRSLTSSALTVAASSTSSVAVHVVQQGAPIPMAYANQDTGTTYYGYVPILDYLQSQTLQADSFAAFDKADVVTFTRSELGKRVQLYDYWRQMLADYFGVPIDPMGRNHRSSGGLAI